MLRSKCIKVPTDPADGLRISVMSQHTKNDGVTPDPDIVPRVSYRLWWRKLSPKETTLDRYLRREISFETFEQCYRYRLFHDAEAYDAVIMLIGLARVLTVTILCVEESPEYCHRRVLLEVCKGIAPDLEIVVA